MSEHDEQVALFRWAEMSGAKYPDLAWMFAIPNGGARHVAVGRKLKAEGVKRGVPDIFLPVARGRFHGLFVEMKTATGVVSKEQDGWIDRLLYQGYAAHVCRGWDDARQMIERYLSLGERYGGD